MIQMDDVHILIVDDDPAAKHAPIHVLQRENYLVAGASSAREALECLEKMHFDLVVTDIRMERMDGIELRRPDRITAGVGAVRPRQGLHPREANRAIRRLSPDF